MSAYRLYCRKDGRFISTAIIEAESDSAAVDQVRVRPGLQYEVWHGSRLVGFLAGSEAGDSDQSDVR